MNLKNLLVLLPLTLLALVTYTSLTDSLQQNIDHLFFLSSSTFIIFGFQVSRNLNFRTRDKVFWCIVLFVAPSIAGLIYWYKHLREVEPS